MCEIKIDRVCFVCDRDLAVLSGWRARGSADLVVVAYLCSRSWGLRGVYSYVVYTRLRARSRVFAVVDLVVVARVSISISSISSPASCVAILVDPR